MTNTTINLNDFTGKSTYETFSKAIQTCRENPGTTFIIPPHTYVIRDESAVGLMNDVMDGKMGNNPQEHIFQHYFPYFRGLDFTECQDITVEGYGARILCDGWMEPLSLENCKNVTVKGLTIDYARKPYSIGKVVADTEDYYDVIFDEKYPVSPCMPTPRIFGYLEKEERFSDEGWDCEKKEEITHQVIRFYGEKPSLTIGETLCVWHSFHFRPAVFIHDSSEICLQEVTLHSQPGMGVVGHRSENLFFKGLRIVPEAGEIMSVDTDATHFTSCKGELSFENCHFEGHGDDALNVHNYYYTIQKQTQNTCEITVEEADCHAQVLDYPDVSDMLELVRADSLLPIRQYQVLAVENFKEEWKSALVLDGDLPGDSTEYYLINITRLPRLKFIGCHVKNHLARAVLIKTRHVLVENCTFEKSMGTALHLAAEGGWREGVASAHVVIRNNRMIGCGYGNQGRIMGASGICINIDAEKTDTVGLHKDILIENNIIEAENAAQGIYISCAEDVVVRYNEISGCREAVEVHDSDRVTVEHNHIR